MVHLIFYRWLRRRFRGQVVIVGSDEATELPTEPVVTLRLARVLDSVTFVN